MRNTQFLKQDETRRVLYSGSRAVLSFESLLPGGDTPTACHIRELAQALCRHAEREYFPVAARKLAELAHAGRGYEFLVHRVHFCASVHLTRGKRHVGLLLRYTVGKEVRLMQRATEIWRADGAYRLK